MIPGIQPSHWWRACLMVVWQRALHTVRQAAGRHMYIVGVVVCHVYICLHVYELFMCFLGVAFLPF